MDGKKERYEREVIGQDTYGCLLTDWKRHQLELQTKAGSAASERKEVPISLSRFRRLSEATFRVIWATNLAS